MDQQRIKALIDLLSHSDLTELSLTEGSCTLTLARDTVPLPPTALREVPSAEDHIAPSQQALAHEVCSLSLWHLSYHISTRCSPFCY